MPFKSYTVEKTFWQPTKAEGEIIIIPKISQTLQQLIWWMGGIQDQHMQ